MESSKCPRPGHRRVLDDPGPSPGAGAFEGASPHLDDRAAGIRRRSEVGRLGARALGSGTGPAAGPTIDPVAAVPRRRGADRFAYRLAHARSRMDAIDGASAGPDRLGLAFEEGGATSVGLRSPRDGRPSPGRGGIDEIAGSCDEQPSSSFARRRDRRDPRSSWSPWPPRHQSGSEDRVRRVNPTTATPRPTEPRPSRRRPAPKGSCSGHMMHSCAIRVGRTAVPGARIDLPYARSLLDDDRPTSSRDPFPNPALSLSMGTDGIGDGNPGLQSLQEALSDVPHREVGRPTEMPRTLGIRECRQGDVRLPKIRPIIAGAPTPCQASSRNDPFR